MSFSGTPLGQGRRLDHRTFLNKANPASRVSGTAATASRQPPNSPPRPVEPSVPTSYSYGAPTQITRSPPKPISASSSRDSRPDTSSSSNSHPAVEAGPDSSQELPALARFARIKERESNQTQPQPAPSAVPKPSPSRWSVKGTSVQIANAFQIAAESSNPADMAQQYPNHSNDNDNNASWSSSNSTLANNRPHVPRSTSVEYEKETQTTRHLPIKPPSRNAGPPPARSTGSARQPLAKQQSLQYVPASDEDEEGQPPQPARKERGKSPLIESVADFARRTAFYLRAPSQEPQPGPSEGVNGRANGNGHNKDVSYDYSAEQAEYEKNRAVATNNNSNGSSNKPTSRKSTTHRRGVIPEDAKAYRPNPEELYEDSSDGSSDGRPRRRKKKKGKKEVGGPLNTLPVTTYGKQRRKRRSKGGPGEDEEGEDEDEEQGMEQEQEQEQESGPEKVGEQVSPSSSLEVVDGPDGEQLQSSQRLSLPPPILIRKPSREPEPLRGSVPPEPPHFDFVAHSTDDIIHSGLASVEEETEEVSAPDTPPRQQRQRPRAPSAYSVGGLLGKLVHLTLRVFVLFITKVAHFSGRAIGTTYNVLFRKPAHFLSTTDLGPLLRMLLVAFVVVASIAALRHVDIPLLSGRSQAPIYQAPDIPASSVADIAARLQALENAVAGLSLDTQQYKVKVESGARVQHDVAGRVDALQALLQKETGRAADDRQVDRTAASQGLAAVRADVQALRDLVGSLSSSTKDKGDKKAEDARARAALAALEERVASVEGDVREALDMGKAAVKVPSSMNAPAWWTKIASGGKPLSIKSADGQDVTDVIGALVEAAVGRHAKDIVAKADYALYSGGARAIPSRTSPTLDIVPDGILGKLAGIATRGSGYAVGRPPVTAIHHETHLGHCWPFAGDSGHLGVKLARHVVVDEVTIDHIPQELALDMGSAPRRMELWGLVEGAENVARVREWEEERAARADAAGDGQAADNDDTGYPEFLPKGEKHVRVAAFEYDTSSDRAVQTFEADAGLRTRRVDFGLVTLRIVSNWGQDFTCLYRMRVHGRQLAQGREAGDGGEAEMLS